MCLQPARADDDSSLLVETTSTVEVVAAPGPDSPGDASAPTSASSHVSIEGTQLTTWDLGTSLREIPSVALRRTGAPGSPVSASLRGSAADQIVVKLGGLPLTPPGGGPVNLSSIAPSLLDGIVVTRGTEAAVHGAGALGGVVLLDPISTLETPAPTCGQQNSCLEPASSRGVEQREWSVRSDTLGSIGLSASRRMAEGPSRVVAGVDLHSTMGRFRYERLLTPNLPGAPWVTEERVGNGALVGAALLAARVPAPAGGELSLTLYGHEARNGIGGMVGFPTPGATSDSSMLLMGGVFEGTVSSMTALSLSTWLSIDGYEFDPGSDGAPVAGTAFRSRRNVLGVRASTETLVAGTILRAHAETTTESLEGTGVQASRPSGSLSIADTAFLFDDRLLVHVALRADAFQDLPLIFMARAGARFEPTSSLSLFANRTLGSRMPSLFELHGETSLVSKNPNLEPETASTMDGGIEAKLRSTWLRLGAWRSHYDDLIAYELYPPLRLRPLNVGEAVISGVELELATKPVEELTVLAAYTFTQATSLSPAPNVHGRALPYRPRHRAYSRATAALGMLSLYGDVELQSSYPRNRANTKWIPSRLILGTGASAKLGRGYFFALSLTNLLDDRRLEDLFGYPLPGRAAFFLLGFDTSHV